MTADALLVVAPEYTVQRGIAGNITRPTPAGLCTDWGILVKWIDVALPGETTLIVPTYPEYLDGDNFRISMEYGHGWKTAPTSDTGWHTFTRPAGLQPVHVGVLSAINDPFINDVPPAVLADRLWRWFLDTGAHYRHTPGVAALASIRAMHSRHPRWLLRNPATVEYWQPPANVNSPRRSPVHSGHNPFTGCKGHKWDMRSAFLAAMAAVELPYYQLHQTGPAGSGVGYYRVKLSEGTAGELYLHRDELGTAWMCHPRYDLLRNTLRRDHEVIDSVTAEGDDTGRLYREWAEGWRDRMAETYSPAERGVYKAGYAQAVGLMAVKSGSVYRPDHRHMIIDQAAASLCRRIHRVRELCGMIPVAVETDSVTYFDLAGVVPDELTLDRMHRAIGVGEQIGRMRYEGMVTL